MASWSEIEADAPEFANGELTFGSMPDSRKGAYLARDPRIGLHSPSVDPPDGDASGWVGEAKIYGAAAATDTGYCADISEVALTYVGTPADHLVVESWHRGRGYQRRTRA